MTAFVLRFKIRLDEISFFYISVDIPSTIEDEVIQVAEQDYGLICPSSGQLIPLKAFHIRAQLVDVTAEVCTKKYFFKKSFY